ncbi:hypothetical protein OROHE_009208 [Orobanche hederae]
MNLKVKLEGDINRGVVFYKKALYYNWHYADAIYNLGVAYGEMLKFDMAICYQGKIDAAASMIEKVIIANPTYAEGVVYRDTGDIALAINAYEQCLKIDPDSRNAGQVCCTENRLLARNYIDEGNDDKLFGAHTGHWILTVINDTKDKVYFLDSLGNRTRGNRKQRPGTLECGFCVCRYMKEIIESDDPDLEKMYGGGPVRDKYYIQAQYDEVLDDWSQFIYSHLI